MTKTLLGQKYTLGLLLMPWPILAAVAAARSWCWYEGGGLRRSTDEPVCDRCVHSACAESLWLNRTKSHQPIACAESVVVARLFQRPLHIACLLLLRLQAASRLQNCWTDYVLCRRPSWEDWWRVESHGGPKSVKSFFMLKLCAGSHWADSSSPYHKIPYSWFHKQCFIVIGGQTTKYNGKYWQLKEIVLWWKI